MIYLFLMTTCTVAKFGDNAIFNIYPIQPHLVKYYSFSDLITNVIN